MIKEPVSQADCDGSSNLVATGAELYGEGNDSGSQLFVLSTGILRPVSAIAALYMRSFSRPQSHVDDSVRCCFLEFMVLGEQFVILQQHKGRRSHSV